MGNKSLRAGAVAGLVAGVGLALLPGVASATPNVTNAVNHLVSGHSRTHSMQSSNWSGYVETGSGFTSASATWTVPSASGSGFSSAWVGIDGDGNSDLIQTGTESDANGQYYAWWEILPAAETPIDSVAVSPGDTMTASVQQDGGSTWTISITDESNGQNFSTQQNYDGPGQSVEYIQEAPEINGSIATMPNFSTFSFSNLTVNGGDPNLTADDEIVCVQNNTAVSTPSAPNGSGDGFSVSYTG
jgi:Peptidase A4 family